MTDSTTYTLGVPGAVLYYDVRRNDDGAEPVLLLIGAPMGASGFRALAGHFDDRTVVTCDPRGAERSKRADGASGSSPDEHADDLHRLISTLDAAQVDIFASSGGAVNALALVAKHPGQVRTLVAHEPPSFQQLPDREQVLAACVDIHSTYQRSGFGPAMAKFIALVSYDGPIPVGFADSPAPDPARFGLPADDDGSRDHPLLGQHMILCPEYAHDFGAIRAASSRVVVARGSQSANIVTGRAAASVAQRLGTAPVTFAGGHDGFATEPEAFAKTLREVLAG
jgi:pimeloyl-ACP methyl ester carboxylesterase